eukprot:959680_1
MSVNCDPLFLQIEQNDMNEAWLEEDYGSVFSVFDIDDFVTGIKITIYASVSLVTLIWTCLSCYIRGQIKRQNVALSIKNTRTLNSSLETTTTKPPQSEQTTQNNANKEGITQHIVALLCGYFVGAHIADSYDSYVEVGCMKIIILAVVIIVWRSMRNMTDVFYGNLIWNHCVKIHHMIMKMHSFMEHSYHQMCIIGMTKYVLSIEIVLKCEVVALDVGVTLVIVVLDVVCVFVDKSVAHVAACVPAGIFVDIVF